MPNGLKSSALTTSQWPSKGSMLSSMIASTIPYSLSSTASRGFPNFSVKCLERPQSLITKLQFSLKDLLSGSSSSPILS